MHNAYGAGDIEISFALMEGKGLVPGHGGTAVTIAGHDAIYQRIDERRERWIVDIEAMTIDIRVTAASDAHPAHLAEGHAIIDSLRAEAWCSEFGFRLVFTLTTDDWDSG